jgi:hypothetical protein
MSASPASNVNRREFTQTAVLAGAALASGAGSTQGANLPARRIRVAFIGCGRVSRCTVLSVTILPWSVGHR